MKIVEAGWYQQIEDEGLKITFLPAQHWSKRSVRDGGQRLWGAFMLQGDNISLYYSGDTGYSSHFREIPDLFGAPDYALLGIGAYKPRWFMRPNHIPLRIPDCLRRNACRTYYPYALWNF